MEWENTRSEHALVVAITERALRMVTHKHPPSKQELAMDITCCHLNDVRLELAELLDSPDEHFSHDVFGIHQNLDRETGKLQNCFHPRHAVREEE